MECPKCHFENTDTSRFCAECGTKLIEVRRDVPNSPESGPKNSQTKTLQAPIKELTTGATFAGRCGRKGSPARA